MTKLDELQKAIEEAAATSQEMIRKSQMTFDFTAPNPHAHDHHVAYTRTNASGTVSNIAAKGAPTVHPLQAEADKHRAEAARYDAEAKEHEKGVNHPNPTSARYSLRLKHEKEGMARHHKAKAEEIENQIAADKPGADSHTAAKMPAQASVADQLADLKTPQDGTTFDQRLAHHGRTQGLRQEEIDRTMSAYHATQTAQDASGHTWASSAHTEAAARATDPVYRQYHEESAAYHKKEADSRQSPAKQQLLDGVHKVGNDLLNNPMMAAHHDNIRRKLEGLKTNPTAKYAAQVAGDLKLMAEKAKAAAKKWAAAKGHRKIHAQP